jgi:hypothetical protein
MFAYSPPGHLDDLAGRPTRAGFLADWHTFILGNFTSNIAALGPDPLFFTENVAAAASGPVGISWNAFPLALSRRFGTGPRAWEAADALRTTTNYTPAGRPAVTTHYRPQDEYCEWFAYTDPATGRIARLVFTAEGPEYWLRLASADFDQVLALYRQHVDPSVQPADLQLKSELQYDDGTLLPVGSYDPFNPWNTTKGVMHLTHPANTLGAEINLAAQATRTRRDHAGARVGDVRRLICCAGYGDPNRSSDPNIGWTVNTTCVPIAAGAAAVDATLADPVALYINGLQEGVVTGPSGEALDDWFRFVRGGSGLGLMAVLEPPPGAAFGLDQVSVGGVPLRSGGQVAAAIDMVLYAKVKPHSGAPPPPVTCSTHCCMPAGTSPGALEAASFSVAAAGDPCGQGLVDPYPDVAAPAHARELGMAAPVPARRTRRAGG